MTTLDPEDLPKILEFLQIYKRGKRYYNLNKGEKKELDQLIKKLKEI